MNDTVTDTMVVDLTKKDNPTKKNVVIDDNTVNCIRKKVGWHSKKDGNKKVVIGKTDKLDVEVGEYVYILTEKEFKRLKTEGKSWWKKILSR